MNYIKTRIQNYFKNSQSVLGINERNVSLIYPHNERQYYKLADDKILTKQILEQNCISCAKTYAVIERIGDIAKKWDTIDKYDKIAIKPANGSGGGGIKILRKNDQGLWCSNSEPINKEEIFLHMASIIMGQYSLGSDDRILIEECIEPHPFFSEIYPDGVPDFRVILLNEKPLMAMLRVPTNKSDGKANLHQGGLGIGIDMKKGTLQFAFDGTDYFEDHPDNQNLIYNKRIPYWEQIIALSLRVAKHFPLNYLGVDIVIDKVQGPLIMEVNVRPGLGIQLANQYGLKNTLKN
ncbi:MAG: sugar-transfer associated ATP-grasp domain-containing protein [bacterium]